MRTGLCMILCVLLILSGCAGGASRTSDEQLEKPQNVIALSSSIAEIWLLAGGRLSGVTDDAVKERDLGLPENILIVGTVKEPSIETILEAEPDLVLLSRDITSHAGIAETLDKAGIPHFTAKVETLEDYLGVLRSFADMTGSAESFEENGDRVAKEVARLLSRLPDIRPEDRKTALFLRAFSSGVKTIASDHTVCYIFDDIGVDNIASGNASLLEDLSVEAIIEADPDYIFVVTMGDKDAAVAELERSLMSNPAWNSLSAVQNGNMVILPKELYHYKPNNRWGQAYENLLKIIYPEIYS